MENKRSAAVSILSHTVIRTLIVLAIMVAIEWKLFGQIKYYATQYNLSVATKSFTMQLNSIEKGAEDRLPTDGCKLSKDNQKALGVNLPAFNHPKEGNISGGYKLNPIILLPPARKRHPFKFHFYHEGSPIPNGLSPQERMVRNLVVLLRL
jgi:hypothetical protein